MTSEALLGASGRGLPAGSAGGGTAGCPGVFQHRDPVLFLKLPRTKDDGQLPSMSTQLLKAAVPAETGLGDSEDTSFLLWATGSDSSGWAYFCAALGS